MSTDRQQGFSYRWVILAAAFLSILVGFGQQFSFGVFLKSLLDEFGLSRSLTSGPFSAYALSYGAFSILVGMLSDRYGHRKVVIGGGFVMGLGLLLSSQVSSFWQIYISYGVLVGIGAGAVYVAFASAVNKLFPSRRGFALGVLLAGFGIGALIVPPVTNHLVLQYGWRMPFAVLAAAVWIVVIPCGLLLRPTPIQAAVSPGNGKTKEGQTPYAYDTAGISLRQALRHPSLWVLVIFGVAVHWGQFMFLGHIVVRAIDVGLPAAVGANTVALFGVGSLVGTLGLGALSDRAGRKPLIAACAVAEAAALFWAVTVSSPWSFYLLGLFLGTANGGWRPLIPALIGDLFGTRAFGAIFGVQLVGHAIGAAIGPVLTGYIFDVPQSYALGFIVPAVFIVLTSSLIPFARSSRS